MNQNGAIAGSQVDCLLQEFRCFLRLFAPQIDSGLPVQNPRIVRIDFPKRFEIRQLLVKPVSLEIKYRMREASL